MWALRRASHPLRNHYSALSVRACYPKLECVRGCFEVTHNNSNSPQALLDGSPTLKRFYSSRHAASQKFSGSYAFSSQAGAKSGGEEDDIDDAFSELEMPANTDAINTTDKEDENKDALISESELSDDEDIEKHSHDNIGIQDSELDPEDRKQRGGAAVSPLYNAIVGSPGQSVQQIMDKWLEEGKTVDREEAGLVISRLRKRRMFARALQFSECLERSKLFDIIERDHASRLDLIAKLRGVPNAESYMNKIPQSFRGEIVHRTLLAHYVTSNNLNKAEGLFKKMRDQGFPVTLFACNQLLLLYKKNNKKKIADVLLLMEKEDIKPSILTYKILIDAKGQYNDITGMDKILETMKAEGVEPDLKTQAILARHYTSGGLKEKAEAILKDMEGGNLEEHRWACRLLLPLYADLGRADEVSRVWKVCESNPRLDECGAAIEAWGKLKKVDEAEAIFEILCKNCKKPTSRQYSSMLKVYANNKMLSKGKELIKRMADNGCRIGPLAWDALVKLYTEAGEVEKADSILQKAVHQNQLKPLFTSYMVLMEQYANRGDVHNAEKTFHRMRQIGYTSRMRQFQCLIKAYVNAKTPAYGMKERMEADNVSPSKYLERQLALVDAFRKTAASDLLD